MSFLNNEIQLQVFSRSPIKAVVGEGVEFAELSIPILIGGDAILNTNINIDIAEDSILFDFSALFDFASPRVLDGSISANFFPGFEPPSNSYGSYVFSDSSGLLPAIWNVTSRQLPDIEFTEDSISIDISNSSFNGNTLITLDVDFEGDFIRFRNSDTPGTYLYATGDEANNIRNNLPGFIDEGKAFNTAIEPDDNLIPFYRFQNNQIPGAYLLVGEQERNNINSSPNFSDTFTEEGIAFYVLGAETNQGNVFFRFQNSDVPGIYLYATGNEADNIRDNLTNFIDEGVAFKV